VVHDERSPFSKPGFSQAKTGWNVAAMMNMGININLNGNTN
jgi:hypothetical protein